MKNLPKLHKMITLTRGEYLEVKGFLRECHYIGFTGTNNYYRIKPEREFFYRWHLNELIKKFSKPRTAQMVFVTLNVAELRTIGAMFQRMDCESSLRMKFSQKDFEKYYLHNAM